MNHLSLIERRTLLTTYMTVSINYSVIFPAAKTKRETASGTLTLRVKRASARKVASC
jgi:hypothetical protein